jgi:hypothetical protein
MIIALINWRILPGKVDAFLEKWQTGLRLNNAAGLIGEFLSKVEDATFFDGITWEMESDEKDNKNDWRSESYVSYVNVGMWDSTESFMSAVGKYMSAGRTIKEDFEAAPRRRAGALAARSAELTGEHVRRCGSLNGA